MIRKPRPGFFQTRTRLLFASGGHGLFALEEWGNAVYSEYTLDPLITVNPFSSSSLIASSIWSKRKPGGVGTGGQNLRLPDCAFIWLINSLVKSPESGLFRVVTIWVFRSLSLTFSGKKRTISLETSARSGFSSMLQIRCHFRCLVSRFYISFINLSYSGCEPIQNHTIVSPFLKPIARHPIPIRTEYAGYFLPTRLN